MSGGTRAATKTGRRLKIYSRNRNGAKMKKMEKKEGHSKLIKEHGFKVGLGLIILAIVIAINTPTITTVTTVPCDLITSTTYQGMEWVPDISCEKTTKNTPLQLLTAALFIAGGIILVVKYYERKPTSSPTNSDLTGWFLDLTYKQKLKIKNEHGKKGGPV